jgi:hypothetical protein
MIIILLNIILLYIMLGNCFIKYFISLVYLLLYKIVHEYSWNNFNKLEGFILIFSNYIIILFNEVSIKKI